jgi:hypothetical protein
MDKKYHSEQVPAMLRHSSAQVITNDLYLAAFLHSAGCCLARAERNDRRRMSFVFAGDRVHELREAYRLGPVRLDMRSFRDSLLHIRHLMDAELGKRSVSHVERRELQTEPNC